MSLTKEARPWNENVVREYLTATSQQKSDPEKFYKTHLDIDRIYAEFLADKQDTIVTQADLRDTILSGDLDDDIRTYILKGETGSGKSQLCQWLDYELQGLRGGSPTDVEERIPLHIKASETSLEQIIETLAEPLGIDPEISQVSGLDPSKVADAITTNLSANPGQKLEDADIDRIIEEGGLTEMLRSNIEQYQRGLEAEDETDFDPDLISKDDYRDLALKLGSDSVFHSNQRVLRQVLRDEIHRHFSHVIGVTDFQGQLLQYTEQYIDEMGKRPVIICEDVTTFSVLKEQLLDQIIQVESASFDIVLGYTTGFEQDDLQDALGDRESQDALTYLKDRAEGYMTLTENGESLFLDDALSIELVRKYLDVIKAESGSTIDETTEDVFDGLYPFNETAIRVAYDNLIDDGSPRRTPRVLLQKVVRRCLLSDEPPFETLDRSTNVDDVISPIDQSKYSADLRKVATWYGYKKDAGVSASNNPILVPIGVLDHFEIDPPDEAERFESEEAGSEYVVLELNNQIALTGGERTRPSVIGDDDGDRREEEDAPEIEVDRPGTAGNGDGVSDGPKGDDSGSDIVVDPPPEPPEENVNTRLKEFNDWFETGQEYSSSDVLRSGAEEVLEKWYDSTRVANPNASTTGVGGIYFTHGSSVPVSIQGPDERKDLSVMLEFNDGNLDLYFDILQVGMHDGEGFPNDVNAERLHAWATDSVVQLRHDIRERVEACLPEELSIEHVIVFSKFLLRNAEFGDLEVTRELVFDEATPKHDRDYKDPIRAALGNNSPLDEQLKALKKRRTEITDLVKGFFLLKKNLVDHDRLRAVEREVADDPAKYLDLAQQINTEKLDYPEWYEIGTNRGNANTNVTTFLDAVSDYAVQVSLLSEDDLEEHFAEHLDAVEKWFDPEHTKADLLDAFDTLDEALGVFDVTRDGSWNDAKASLTTEGHDLHLNKFNSVLSDLRSTDRDTPFERLALLHDFQRSLETHDAWDVYKALDEMIEVLSDQEVDATDDVEEQVKQLQELQQYERARQNAIKATEEF
ncbi:hypothetical protein [Candidatus Halobonum tyrrellensis]|uniref:Uncharacterized protein n=1 Tax=Candidatus Halobonum tyrrellensis G22 TaxID=1324957 RepID=V4H832_9EURY|nr:hypothetical protein [Candidatus Halobonum tyrrellensis]ESP86830.1 hypothetical protein K933_17142 [Candidatus Halobonum tyrrellensis G22]